MSKKRTSKKRTTKKRQSQPQPDSAPAMFNPRMMEKTLADLGKLLNEREFETTEEVNAFLEEAMASGMPEPRAAETPLEQAQEIMYAAWGESSKRRRVQLARKALSISEDCADAYVLLAQESARTLDRAMKHFEEGVKAGERALGEDAFEEYAGHFWGVVETRPYMRAREGLALCLWESGQHEEAIEHYQEMLRLNPGDNQGIRYTLLRCLLVDAHLSSRSANAEEREAEAEQLLADYEEDASAAWCYTQALLLFRKDGPGLKATSRLCKAMQYNPHVPDLLLGRKRVPRQLPPYIGFGDETEAAAYVADMRELWTETPGALAWLEEVWAEMA